MKRYLILIFIFLVSLLSISHAENLNKIKEKLKVTKQDLSSTPFKLYNFNDVSEIVNPFCHWGNSVHLSFKSGPYAGAYAGVLRIYYCETTENAKKFFNQYTAKFKALKDHTVIKKDKKISTRYIYKFKKISKDGFFYLEDLMIEQDFFTSSKPAMEYRRESISYFKTTGSYFFMISLSKPNKDKGFVKTAGNQLYNVILKKLSGESKSRNPEENSDDFEVTVSAESDGFKPSVLEYDIKYGISKKGLNPSSLKEVVLTGNILSYKELSPIPGANVTIKFRGKRYSVKSNNEGIYRKILKLNSEGTRTATINLDLYLTEKAKKVAIKVLTSKFVANGRYQKLKIRVIQENGKPAANKVYFLNYSDFTHNNKKIHYITHPILSKTFKTNKNGFATIIIPTPEVIKSRLNNISDSKKYFPITATMTVSKREKLGTFYIYFDSPFPEIVKFLLPGGMDAEHWQIAPSRIFIKDLDSDTFNIKLMGYGRFKTKGGKIYKTIFHQYRYKGNEFEFYFASDKLGLDLNKQPQVWKDFVDTNLRVLMSTLLTLNEGTSFEEMRKIKKGWLSTVLTDKVSFEKVYGGSKLAFGSRDYKNSVQSFTHNKDKDYVSSADIVVGGAFITNDLVALIKNSSSKLSHNLQMELMKAIYENAKTTYNIYKKYRKIADSYKDLFKINIFVKVTDMDGYSTITTKPIFVKAWQNIE